MTKLHYRSERREPSFGPRSVSGSAGRGRATGIRRSPARVKARSAVSAGEPGEPAGGRPWWDRRVLGGQRDRVRRRVRCERAVMVIRSKGRIWHRRLPGCSSSGTSDQDPGKPLSGLSILVLLGFTWFAGGGAGKRRAHARACNRVFSKQGSPRLSRYMGYVERSCDRRKRRAEET